ncbi:MAG: hypothetical protein NXI23_09305 [Bacteroidetes bacterium]|jgi:hypothetical protein|nr:hypothetical protein [Bacteroidota bacterium]
MDFQIFNSSLNQDVPHIGLPPLLKALWYDEKGDWNKAHDIADGMPGLDAAWVHAYLHRKEGVQWNANYWYRRASKASPNKSLKTEWEEIVRYLLAKNINA